MSAASADAILRRLHAAARRRRTAIVLAFALPWLCALAALAWRGGWTPWPLVAFALALAATAAIAWHRARAIDARWLARRLDAKRPDMEDSAALLLVDSRAGFMSSSPRKPGSSVLDAGGPKSRGSRFRGNDDFKATIAEPRASARIGDALTPLQGLQRERLRHRLEATPPVDLRERWPRRALAVSGACALTMLAAIAFWPAPRVIAERPAPAASGGKRAALATPRLLAARLEIRPPAYTGLPARTQAALDAKLPEGATLRWTLRFAPQPASAVLVFHDGRRIELQRSGDAWQAQLRVRKSALYRIVLPAPLPAAQAGLHRLDVAADAPPTVRAIAPARSLTLRANGQRSWTLLFEGVDDHGLAASARLRLVQTQGGGENITARERTLALRGTGPARRRRWSHAIDLQALGLSPGDDLIASLEVADNRTPRPQRVRSASVILRWPPEAATESSGMDGLVGSAVPAYLRSQRQIIIDAEALLKQRQTLSADAFASRSDALGGDQRALRLRYGRFLGEASEGEPALPTNDLPTNDLPADDLPVNDLPTNDAEDTRAAARGKSDHDHGEAGVASEGHAHEHDHAARDGAPAPFGSAGDVLSEFGHAHDTAEAATLFDPETRETLRGALREMWQSELHLRQGDPATALPFARRALASIKEVQQADRIYLARTAVQPPPIDEGRRLGGDRSGLGDRRDVLAAPAPVDPVPAAAWRALQDAPSAHGAAPDFEALARWARGLDEDGDVLTLFAAMDAARGDPDCAPCRARLRQALWPLLPRPPAAPGTRPRMDAAGAAYLDALRGEEAR